MTFIPIQKYRGNCGSTKQTKKSKLVLLCTRPSVHWHHYPHWHDARPDVDPLIIQARRKHHAHAVI